MSHQPERKEKDCLNCGSIVQGRFCHVCGQENIVPHQNFWSLIKHFVYDIFHFDGKFFDTLRNMFTRPGIVAREYAMGRRVKYLDPIRMYLFTSTLFFLIFFSMLKPEVAATDGYMNKGQRAALARELKGELGEDPSNKKIREKIALLLDTVHRPRIRLSDVQAVDQSSIVSIGREKYGSAKAYDSLQNLLPAAKRDNWFERKLVLKGFEMDEKYGGSSRLAVKDFTEGLLHRLPYLLFLSLPFFALLLKLLYARRKQFFYSDHAVFTLYHYILSFMVLLAFFIFNYLEERLGWGVFGYLTFGATLYWLYYLYKSMRNFYGQSRMKTLGKFLLLNFMGFIVIVLLFVIFVFLSIFQM